MQGQNGKNKYGAKLGYDTHIRIINNIFITE
jgi:hypothetical protein